MVDITFQWDYENPEGGLYYIDSAGVPLGITNEQWALDLNLPSKITTALNFYDKVKIALEEVLGAVETTGLEYELAEGGAGYGPVEGAKAVLAAIKRESEPEICLRTPPVYVKVKLSVAAKLTDEEIEDIVESMDYSFDHPQILKTEIMGVEDDG